MKPYFEDLKAGIRIFNCKKRELDDETLRCDCLLCDPPYGLSEAKGKNKSRTKLAVAKDYGTSDWDDQPPSDFDLIRLRDLTKWPDMNPISVELYRRCPNAGKTFKHPVMEEVK